MNPFSPVLLITHKLLPFQVANQSCVNLFNIGVLGTQQSSKQKKEQTKQNSANA